MITIMISKEEFVIYDLSSFQKFWIKIEHTEKSSKFSEILGQLRVVLSEWQTKELMWLKILPENLSVWWIVTDMVYQKF